MGVTSMTWAAKAQNGSKAGMPVMHNTGQEIAGEGTVKEEGGGGSGRGNGEEMVRRRKRKQTA